MAIVHFPLLQDYPSTTAFQGYSTTILLLHSTAISRMPSDDSTNILWQFHGYPLTIMRVSCESSDFWSIFHCFHPSVCRICTIDDICFPPIYKAIKHLQKLRSKREDISSFALALTATSAHSFGGWEDRSANVNKYTCQLCAMKSCASEQSHMVRKI